MHRSRQTKIVASVGPGSSTEEMLVSLFQAGAVCLHSCSCSTR